jgi:hypothetical protein
MHNQSVCLYGFFLFIIKISFHADITVLPFISKFFNIKTTLNNSIPTIYEYPAIKNLEEIYINKFNKKYSLFRSTNNTPYLSLQNIQPLNKNTKYSLYNNLLNQHTEINAIPRLQIKTIEQQRINLFKIATKISNYIAVENFATDGNTQPIIADSSNLARKIQKTEEDNKIIKEENNTLKKTIKNLKAVHNQEIAKITNEKNILKEQITTIEEKNNNISVIQKNIIEGITKEIENLKAIHNQEIVKITIEKNTLIEKKNIIQEEKNNIRVIQNKIIEEITKENKNLLLKQACLTLIQKEKNILQNAYSTIIQHALKKKNAALLTEKTRLEETITQEEEKKATTQNTIDSIKEISKENNKLSFLKYIPWTQTNKIFQKNTLILNDTKKNLLFQLQDINDITSFYNDISIIEKLKAVYNSLSFIQKTAVIATPIIASAICSYICFNSINLTKIIKIFHLDKIPTPWLGSIATGIFGVYSANNFLEGGTPCTKCNKSTNRNRKYCFDCGGPEDQLSAKT